MDINPLELLKEEMENDDVAIRVNAMHRLKIVAAILGPEGIKQQLLPYLDQLLKKEEDEVLFAIADELNNIAPLLQQQQTILVPFLENLAAQEETVVREKAVSTLITMSKTLNDNDIQNVYIPMILRLANNDQNFTCRVSAVNLMVPIYQSCLLYTSDAADDMQCVDLGGRRTIKKKKKVHLQCDRLQIKEIKEEYRREPIQQ
eukprot:TRINITY_DN10164_c0_g1_i2.p1 TRINITY_DN10164_c0_g1~~TRINITY_DN10164_c0_g1_i2.p1  ORF type:complete len:203 (+),score=48.00 TRINITY_DN10164_c0_g1_i2:84-692(+)